MEVHHAGEGRGEPHAVRHRAVARQPHELVALRHVVQKAVAAAAATRTATKKSEENVYARVCVCVKGRLRACGIMASFFLFFFFF